MLLSPIVNTDVKMPRKMFEALTLHETCCLVTNVHSVTEDSVKEFLCNRYGEKLADNFDPKFLFNSQVS